MYISSDNSFWNWFFCCWKITSDGYNIFSLLKLIIWKYLMILCWFVLSFLFFSELWSCMAFRTVLVKFWNLNSGSDVFLLLQFCLFCFSFAVCCWFVLSVVFLLLQLCFFCFSCVFLASVVFFFCFGFVFLASVLFILLQFAVCCCL